MGCSCSGCRSCCPCCSCSCCCCCCSSHRPRSQLCLLALRLQLWLLGPSCCSCTRGSYSYVDANGIVQTVNYISDAMGFRVAATNLPVHNVEGNSVEPVVQPEVAYAYLPYAQNYGYAAPAAA